MNDIPKADEEKRFRIYKLKYDIEYYEWVLRTLNNSLSTTTNDLEKEDVKSKIKMLKSELKQLESELNGNKNKTN